MPAFILKIIALATMLIDHTGAVFPGFAPDWFRTVGRASFVLFVFLIAESCRHTRSMEKYLFRLGLFALISQIPFSLAFGHGFKDISFIESTNVFYTLFLGVLCVYSYQFLQKAKSRLSVLLIIPYAAALGYLAVFLDTDYDLFGVLFVLLVYVMPNKPLRLLALAGLCLAVYGDALWWFVTTGNQRFLSIGHYWNLFASLSAVVLAAFYNGKRGPSMKWLFYAAYPAHLLLFALIK
ncbi:MAG: conjugal transfer protein TraX [Clostridiales bacterium]|jgi:hypothetical protein|nr:conjugal transfer protein TraX [Clostridiales bacterium]